MSTLYLVRHAQASFGARNYDRLSILGLEQARVLGTWIRHCNLSVDRVVMGSNRRHRETAEACCAMLPQAPPDWQWQVASGFSEFDHVEVLRCYRPDLSDGAALNSWLATVQDPPSEFQRVFACAFQRWVRGEQDGYAEPYARFKRRCWRALTPLLQQTGTAWVFTSGGPIAAILQQALTIDPERIAELTWSLVNTGVTKLGCRSGRVQVSGINQHAHLQQTGRPEWITYR